MDGETDLSDIFQESEFFDAANFSSAATSPQDDLFAVLQAWESSSNVSDCNPVKTLENDGSSFEFQKSARVYDADLSDHQPKCRKQKVNPVAAQPEDGQQRMSHITVERNRRKQMNEHLSVLRSLMPCFYVKRGDQASIIGGVVNYINELQQILHSLEAKKQRKAYSEVLSPRPASSPLISPRKPPLSPRLSLPISPRTPQPSSPYKPWMQQRYPSGYHLNSPTATGGHMELQLHSPCNSSTNSSINDAVNELVATSKSAVAEVEVKFAGPNLVLKTASQRFPWQAGKIVSALEELALEILQVKISTVDETMLNFFTIKIGIECQLSAEELAQQIQNTFS